MDKNKFKEEQKNNAGKKYNANNLMGEEFATELNENNFKKEYNANLKNNNQNKNNKEKQK